LPKLTKEEEEAVVEVAEVEEVVEGEIIDRIVDTIRLEEIILTLRPLFSPMESRSNIIQVIISQIMKLDT